MRAARTQRAERSEATRRAKSNHSTVFALSQIDAARAGSQVAINGPENLRELEGMKGSLETPEIKFTCTETEGNDCVNHKAVKRDMFAILDGSKFGVRCCRRVSTSHK